MKYYDTILIKTTKLLSSPSIRRAVSAAGMAVATAAKGAMVAAAPYVIPFAVGAAAGYGLMSGVYWVAEKVADGK